ncbi:MAG TPA: asparagine synthase (glutamine-hydrolyzing), partial [Saprospiraceae bacterium]|nr:asparagine synthase (glutamine-hydrolyzing) [Saprospiraceae bacterium]
MCGISGIAGVRDPGILRAGIEKMTRRIAHRGPDAEGFFVENDLALGHRRLSVIDLSEEAKQPMYDVSGRYVLVFNGEMYNYREVRAKLPDYPFRTNSDSETILAAYDRWGADCLEHFNGMFALALWDREKQEMFVARDRLGVKPFYFFQQNGVFVFASELRSLLASGLVPARLDGSAVANYLMYQSVAAPATIVEGVRQLMPGECGMLKAGKLERSYYWRIEHCGATPDMTDATIVRRNIRRLLTESVERRMVSDVPLGAFLSGGIDSSAVVGLMAECSEQPVHTFSITFQEPEFDESKYSALIAKRFNTRHTPILLRPDDFLESLPAALEAMDNPSGDGFNTYLVSKKTKEAGITVALSGIGGDELFAGYASFARWLSLRMKFWWRIPVAFRRSLSVGFRAAARSYKDARMAGLISAELPAIDQVYPFFRQVLPAGQVAKLVRRRETDIDFLQKNLRDRREEISSLPYLSQYSVAELLGYTLNVLLKDTDQMSMASALEVREPFFDYKLVEYVLQIPDALKYPRYPKSLLVESLAPLLPDVIVHRPKKGFTLPWNHWLQHELRGWCQQNLENLAERPEFNGAEV